MKHVWKCKFRSGYDEEIIVNISASSVSDLFEKLLDSYSSRELTEDLISIVKTNEKFI